jgi:hypothetical protein
VKYDHIIESSINNLTSLKRVRVKTDPKHLAKEGTPEKCPSYEGYVLEEGLTKAKILILPPDLSIEEIPIELIEYIVDQEKEDAFDGLKRHIIERLELKENNPLVSQICNCTCINDIETFLKQSGLSDIQISDLYSSFILD